MGAHQEFEAVSGQKSLCGSNCSVVKCCFFTAGMMHNG